MARYRDIWWTGRKAAENVRKHGVSFEDARDALDDPLTIEVPDIAHSTMEDRYFALAESPRGQLLRSHTRFGTTSRGSSAPGLQRPAKNAEP
ncbi:MAG TPA: BrnT family toxin [Thermoanaerobaculia bacterium]